MTMQDTHAEQTVSGRILDGISEMYGVERVFGAPYEKNGTTVIPVARVRGGGGGGGGGGTDVEAAGSGEGGGFGISSEPAGAYVISDEGVAWRPAWDPKRPIMAAAAVAISYFFFSWLRTRATA